MVDNKSKRVYIAILVITSFFLVSLTLVFSMFTPEAGYNYEMLLTAPGLYAAEWLFAIWMMMVMAVVTAFISSILSGMIIKRYVKIFSRKSTVGITPSEDVRPRSLMIKLLARSSILALLSLNVAYMLASQPLIVDIIRTDQEISSVVVPDVLAMYGLLYLVIIPCTFILAIIWISNDVGIIRAKKFRRKTTKSVNLITTPINKAIKGYVGIGFIILLISITLDTFFSTYGAQTSFAGFLLLMSPILIILFVAPAAILVDIKHAKLKEKILPILRNLGLDNEIQVDINLKPLGNSEKIS